MENCEESNNKCTQHPGISCLEMSAFDQLWYQYVGFSRSRGFSAQRQERKWHQHLPIKIDSLVEESFLENTCDFLFFLRLKSIQVSLHDCQTATQACHRPRQNMRRSPSNLIASNKIHSVDNSTVLTCLTLFSGSEKTSITTSHFACLKNSYANNNITVHGRASWPSVEFRTYAQLQPTFKLSLWRENCGRRWVCDVRIVEQDTSFGMLN